jgi:hypothetical protein
MIGKFNTLDAELNPTCHLLTLLAHQILHVDRIRVKGLLYAVTVPRQDADGPNTQHTVVCRWCTG